MFVLCSLGSFASKLTNARIARHYTGVQCWNSQKELMTAKMSVAKSAIGVIRVERRLSHKNIWYVKSVVCTSGQVIAWQSTTLLPISCRSVQPVVPARVEEPVAQYKAVL